jgi:hypothetical protein
MGQHAAPTWKIRNEHKILVGKPERKRSFRTQILDWGKIKMDFKYVGFADIN